MRAPRLLPLVGIAVGGVLAVKALTGVAHLPDLVQGAKAFAEGVVPAKTQDVGAPKLDPNAPVLPPGLSPKATPLPGSPEAVAAAANLQAQAAPPRLACSATPADLARDAGLSPAELQVLQSLGARRGQLDLREQDIDVQTQLLTTAGAKLDAKLQALAAMKVELQKLLGDGDQKKSAEIDNLVAVYSKMKARDAADRMSLLDDSVRLPIAAKMKAQALSAILGQMAPAQAKEITEKLAGRFESKLLADARSAVSGQTPPAAAQPAGNTPPAPAAQAANAANAATPAATPPAPTKVAKARPKPKKKAKPATQLAANAPAHGQSYPKPSAATPAAAASPAGQSAAPATPAPAAAKSG
ncbi:MAG TPA: MotE family protein [Caulobacteraceae bacterium]